jgi:hypothetical protein
MGYVYMRKHGIEFFSVVHWLFCSSPLVYSSHVRDQPTTNYVIRDVD